MGGINRVFFGKKEEAKEEVVEEEVKVTEKDKLTSYIRNKRLGTYREGFLLDTIKEHYVENTNSYEKCKDYIDFISDIEEDYIRNRTGFNKDLFFLYMSNDNSLIISAIIKLALHSTDCNYISYLVDSRSYFSDNETWFARVYEVINNYISPEKALEEDKMRIGIYPNLSQHKAEEIVDIYNDLFDRIKDHIRLAGEIETKLEKSKEEALNMKKETVCNINSTYQHSLKNIRSFADESIEKIKSILEINPSSKKEILEEIRKQYDVIEWFNNEENIKERYERLLLLKEKDVIYHPKFNEVLKYYLAGNTVCLNGPSKCGKTTLANHLARLLNLEFYNLGTLCDEVSDINGYYDFNTNYNKSVFQKAFENGGVTLIKNINNSPKEVINSLNNIVGNFSYNPYVFGDKLITTPSKNFRLIMTNNNSLILDRTGIDNLVHIDLDYDTEFEDSLTKDKRLIEFLHNLRKNGVNITTSTIVDITKHLELGLFSLEELLENYIISTNSTDLLNRTLEKIDQSNTYNQTLKKVLKR